MGVAVGELEIGQAAGGVGIAGDTYYDCEFVGAGYGAVGNDRGTLGVARGSGLGGLQEEGSVVNALPEVCEGDFNGVAAGMETEAVVMGEVELAQNAVRHAGGAHDGVGGLRVDFGVDRTGADLRGALCNVNQDLIEVCGGDYRGGVGLELQLNLRNFEGDRFDDVGSGGGEEQRDGRQDD